MTSRLFAVIQLISEAIEPAEEEERSELCCSGAKSAQTAEQGAKHNCQLMFPHTRHKFDYLLCLAL